ncbi:unnamed protein product, partial [Owenia fusiformis]
DSPTTTQQQQSCLIHVHALHAKMLANALRAHAAAQVAVNAPTAQPRKSLLEMAVPVTNAKNVIAEIPALMRTGNARALKDAVNKKAVDHTLYIAIHTPCTYIMAVLC